MLIPAWISCSQRARALQALVAAAGMFCLSAGAQAQTAVVMAQYEPGRTAANLNEHLLAPSNVSPATFGKLFSRGVDDSVYALPLIVPNLQLPGFGSRNVLFVATMGNTVYAFDADDPAAAQPFWASNLGPPAPGGSWIGPVHHGILSTPFIDVGTGTLYVVAKIMKTSSDIGYWIFALDVLTGGSKYNSPRRVDFPFVGGPTLTNVPEGIQRVGLLVSGGTLYVAFASIVPDADPHWSQEGFLQAFDARNLQSRLAIFQATPNGKKGGFWQAGRGVAADTAGNIYLASAAGTYDGAANFGSSVLKFIPRSLQLLDWFTPFNWQYLLDHNIDLSANGVTVIPNSHFLFAGGKSGIVYLLDSSNLGKLEGSRVGPVQSFRASAGCGLTDCAQTLGTAFWAHFTGGTLYVWDRGDVLRAYPFANDRFVTLPSSRSTVQPAMTGGPSVSAEGGDIATGIVWAASMNVDDSGAQAPGTLHAFLASDVSQELYNSNVYGSRDAWGNFTKFATPVVANGKVYVPTQTNAVAVFGPRCGVDITSRLMVSRGPVLSLGRKRYSQLITATNRASHALGAPFDVAFDGLPAGATLTNATGTTSCAGPVSPYLRRTAPLWLQPGESFTLTLWFSSRSKNIPYSTRVLTGGGGR
jgi:hypothetical protein